MYVYLQFFLSILNFQTAHIYFNYWFFFNIVFWMYWKQTCINCDMIAPQFFSFEQTDIIGGTFMFISRGKKLEPSVTLKL